MTPSPISIVFQNYSHPYYPGDTVLGVVRLKNPEPLDARSVTIQWKGVSKTWGFPFSDLKGKEQHLDGEEIVWKAGVKTHQLAIGFHEFPFKFKLPQTCPPSFHSPDGSTIYKVKVEVDRPLKPNLKTEKEFLVTRKLSYKEAEGYGKEDTLVGSCMRRPTWMFKKELVFLRIWLPKKNFYPGQETFFEFTVTNDSNTPVKEIYMSLNQSCHYHATALRTPCLKLNPSSCPLNHRHKSYKTRQIGKESRMKATVAPWSKQSFEVPFNFKDGYMAPNFATGLMTMGHFLKFGFVAENGFRGSRTVTVFMEYL
ncbi:unnamed protein product [Caenorhabditis brenneri]